MNSQKNSPLKQIGYITRMYEQNGVKYLDIDYIQWFSGENADEIAFNDKSLNCIKISGCAPNGYYILNNKKDIRTFSISPNAQIFMQTFSHDSLGKVDSNQKINYDQLKELIETNGARYKQVPFWVEIVGGAETNDYKNGEVIKITEQYIP